MSNDINRETCRRTIEGMKRRRPYLSVSEYAPIPVWLYDKLAAHFGCQPTDEHLTAYFMGEVKLDE